MDHLMKMEIVKDLFGLGAVFIYLTTVLLAAFRWSGTPQPLRAAASIPLVLLVTAYIYKRYFRRKKGTGGRLG